MALSVLVVFVMTSIMFVVLEFLLLMCSFDLHVCVSTPFLLSGGGADHDVALCAGLCAARFSCCVSALRSQHTFMVGHVLRLLLLC